MTLLALLKAFTIARGCPAVLLHAPAVSLNHDHVIRLRRALAGRKFETLDVLITSPGGDPNAAYVAAQVLRSHAKHIRACVLGKAKSAATLLCLGADEIWMDESAELGPLDTQVYGEKIDLGEMGLSSALNPSRAWDMLQDTSLDLLDKASDTVARSRLNKDQCMKHAVQFVLGIMTPLLAQINPEKISQRARDLDVANNYGTHLISHHRIQEEKQRDVDARGAAILKKLVFDCPSHNYAIVYHELKEMGLNVNRFEDKHESIIFPLLLELTWGHARSEFVDLIELKKPSSTRKAETA